VKGNQNAVKYIETLEQYLKPFKAAHYGDKCIFMQDGASIHRANVTKKWLKAREIAVLEWPPRSPDLNPIENVWGRMARKVCDDSRQFDILDELKECILQSWQSLSSTYLSLLAESMPKRCVEVLKKNGKKTHY